MSKSTPRNWHLGEPGWSWPDDVDETGTENRSAYRYLPVLNTEQYSDNVIREWEVARVFVDEDDPEMQADAQLIACAPRMAKALEDILADASNEGCEACYVVLESVIAKAKRVLAEAKGQENA